MVKKYYQKSFKTKHVKGTKIFLRKKKKCKNRSETDIKTLLKKKEKKV